MRERGFEVVSAYAGKGVTLPVRKTAASAGYDFAAAEETVLLPGRVTLVPTGVKAFMPVSEVLVLAIRSSLAVRRQLMLANGIGVIDADYYDSPETEGHIEIAVYNAGAAPVTLKKGERVAQGIFLRYETVTGDTAGEGARRQGGFGSTGREQ